MRRQQCISRLTLWNKRIANKTKTLNHASKVFSVLNYVLKITEAIGTVVLLTLNSFMISEVINDGSLVIFLAISISSAVIQSLLAIATTTDGVINPEKKSNDCSVCAKQYHQLQLEINVMVDDLLALDEHDEISSEELEKYSYLCLMVQQKEQIILNEEPKVYFTNLKTSITHSSDTPNDLSNEDIHEEFV